MLGCHAWNEHDGQNYEIGTTMTAAAHKADKAKEQSVLYFPVDLTTWKHDDGSFSRV